MDVALLLVAIVSFGIAAHSQYRMIRLTYEVSAATAVLDTVRNNLAIERDRSHRFHRRAQRAESDACDARRKLIGQVERANWWRNEARMTPKERAARDKAVAKKLREMNKTIRSEVAQ